MGALTLSEAARHAIETYIEAVHEVRHIDLYQTLLVWAEERDGARAEWPSVEVPFEELPAALDPYQDVLAALELEWARDIGTVSDFETIMKCEMPAPTSHHVQWHIARNSDRLDEYWATFQGADTPEVGYFFGYPDEAVAAARQNETLAKHDRAQYYIQQQSDPYTAGMAELLVPYQPAPSHAAMDRYLEAGATWFDTLCTIAIDNDLSGLHEALVTQRDERVPVALLPDASEDV